MKKLFSLLMILGIFAFGFNAVAQEQSTDAASDTTVVADVEPDPIPEQPEYEQEEEAQSFDQIIKDKFIEGDPKFMSPVLICLILGLAIAIERIIYALLEKAATDSHEGRKPQFPLWLSPTQVRIIPLKEEFNDFCEKLTDKISTNSVRVDIDDRNESIGKRIREAEKEWIRYILVIGDKEANSENLSIRDRQTGAVRELSFDDFVNEIKEQTKEKPFTGLNFPKHISKRPNLMV